MLEFTRDQEKVAGEVLNNVLTVMGRAYTGGVPCVDYLICTGKGEKW